MFIYPRKCDLDMNLHVIENKIPLKGAYQKLRVRVRRVHRCPFKTTAPLTSCCTPKGVRCKAH